MTEKLYDLAERAARKGWTVIKSTEVRGDGAQAPGAVTLCGTGEEPQPLAVHFFNAQDGGFHNGDYYAAGERAAAEARYAYQAERFTRHHARLDARAASAADAETAPAGPRM